MADKSNVPAKNWKCNKCEGTYESPIRINAVLCQFCTKRARGRETWMTPLED